jgi:hypothetical protein
MATQAIRSAGTLLKVRISGVYTLIPDARGFTGPGGEAPEMEVTPLDNTQAREYLLDLPDPGEFSFQMNYAPGNTVHQYLLTAWKAGTLEAFQITWVSGHVTSFDAFVKNFERSAEQGAPVAADISLKISGAITDP